MQEKPQLLNSFLSETNHLDQEEEGSRCPHRGVLRERAKTTDGHLRVFRVLQVLWARWAQMELLLTEEILEASSDLSEQEDLQLCVCI